MKDRKRGVLEGRKRKDFFGSNKEGGLKMVVGAKGLNIQMKDAKGGERGPSGVGLITGHMWILRIRFI